MKKRAVSVLLAAMMMSTGLCACAAQAQQSAPEQAAESANEVVEIEAEGETEGAEDAAEAAPAETEQVENAQSAAEAGTPADAASGQGTGAGAELEAKERPKFTLEMHSFYDAEQVNDSYLTYANGSYATVKLSEETKAAYPSLDSALKAYSDDCAANAHKWFEEVVDAAKSYRQDYQGSPLDFPSGEMTLKVEPVRCDNEILSFFEISSSYYPGAAHGMSGYSGVNYDTAAGTPIALTDVIKDPSAMAGVVTENIKSTTDGQSASDSVSGLEEYFGENSEELAWAIDRDALVFRFAPSDIAPYALGPLEARIPFAAYPDLFTGKYGPAEGEFARMLDPYQQNMVDLDGDGQTEIVWVTGSYGFEDSFAYEMLEVIVGERGCSEEEYFFSWDSYVLHTQDGRNFVLTETTSDNDYTNLHVFEIKNGKPSHVGKLEGTGFASVYHERPEAGDGSDEGSDDYDMSWYVDKYPILSPSCFALSKQMNLMSTYNTVRFYEMGEDGMPSPLTDYYEIHAERTLTSLTAMEVELVDPATGERTGETMELPEGSSCTLWHTNGEDYVDLLLEDGTAFRVDVDAEWPQSVNGIPLEEAFGGTMFAG